MRRKVMRVTLACFDAACRRRRLYVLGKAPVAADPCRCKVLSDQTSRQLRTSITLLDSTADGRCEWTTVPNAVDQQHLRTADGIMRHFESLAVSPRMACARVDSSDFPIMGLLRFLVANSPISTRKCPTLRHLPKNVTRRLPKNITQRFKIERGSRPSPRSSCSLHAHGLPAPARVETCYRLQLCTRQRRSAAARSVQTVLSARPSRALAQQRGEQRRASGELGAAHQAVEHPPAVLREHFAALLRVRRADAVEDHVNASAARRRQQRRREAALRAVVKRVKHAPTAAALDLVL
eukprot:5237934-Pleurochrysis_carterae.AAC.2